MSGTKILAVLAAVTIVTAALAAPPDYPPARKGEQVDTYFGVAVPDPYRWLEDDNAPETAAWVAAENRLTFGYLAKIPYRQKIKARLLRLLNYPRYGVPTRYGPYYVWTKNNGLQNQSVLYVQRGLGGKPAVLLDPNTLSPDGTTRLVVTALTRNGRYLAYGVSESGSDWVTLRVLEVATRRRLPDTIRWVKFSDAAWRGNDGFYYSRYPQPPKGRETGGKNEFHTVYYHRLGTPQSADRVVYADKAHPDRFHGLGLTEDERFAILSISDPHEGSGNALFFRDESKRETAFRPIVARISDDTFGVVDNIGGTFLLSTDRGAKNGKVVRFDPRRPDPKHWKTILPEKREPLESASTGGGRLFATYLKDVTSRVEVYDLGGKKQHDLPLPGPGSVYGVGGRREDRVLFFAFTSYNYPTTIFRYDVSTRRVRPYRVPVLPGYRASDYVVEQVFPRSRDGTRVPLFLVHRKNLPKNGRNPTLLYGYGGFRISETPYFSASRIAWLEQGGVFAAAALRGGTEYGEFWHEAGMRLRKQNVFDDFIAAAEWLINKGYTSPPKLAMEGGSNGGLLVGAVLNQRPDLFGAAIPEVGVMDMLRFPKFTIGANWVDEYGSPDNEADFRNLLRYSPLHNVKETAYPATLILTADHDDRVFPAHSFKYAATLQEKQRGDAPVLIRIETRSGHGGSSLTKAIETTADTYTFLFHNLGVTPRY